MMPIARFLIYIIIILDYFSLGRLDYVFSPVHLKLEYIIKRLECVSIYYIFLYLVLNLRFILYYTMSVGIVRLVVEAGLVGC